jgi:Zn-dependent peptidase ImmA (M78 family)
MDRFTVQINELYSQYGIPKTFPAPLVDIASKLGYKVSNFKLEPNNLHISGAVLYDTKQILLNPTESNTRRNFTLAHEIGHIVLKHQKEGQLLDARSNITSPTTSKETDANEFAAELLMPEDVFKAKWNETKSMASMAEYFATSLDATAIRIQRLGIDYARG